MDDRNADSLPRIGVLCFDPLRRIAEASLEGQRKDRTLTRKPCETPGEHNECR
jgi:hypothetical protein